MRSIRHDVPRARKRGRNAFVAVALAFGVCAALAATPVGFDTGDGGFTLLWQAAFAAGKGGGNGGGNKGGNGSGNAGGNSAGNSGNAAGNAGGPESGGRDAGRNGSRAKVGDGVVVAQFTTQISKRKPANQVSEVDDPYQAVSFYTELTGMQGHTVTHRWIYKGIVQYRISFPVKGPAWRVWSTQFLPADMPGTWLVEVVDEANRILQAARLVYRPTG